VTVALGLVCTDGVLVASDSMSSDGPVAMVGRKVAAFENQPVVWTASGSVYVIEEVRTSLKKLAPSINQPIKTADHDAIRSKLTSDIHGTMKRCYESALPHGMNQPIAPNVARHAFATSVLILGHHDDKPWFLEFADDGQVNWHHDRRFCAVGSGGPFATVAQALLGHLVDEDLDLHLGKQLAYRAVETTCRASSQYVGGRVQLAIADGDGARVLSDPEVDEVGDLVTRWQELEKDIVRDMRTGDLSAEAAPAEPVPVMEAAPAQPPTSTN
jgi:20S proteasome alpha/beta subunit